MNEYVLDVFRSSIVERTVNTFLDVQRGVHLSHLPTPSQIRLFKIIAQYRAAHRTGVALSREAASTQVKISDHAEL